MWPPVVVSDALDSGSTSRMGVDRKRVVVGEDISDEAGGHNSLNRKRRSLHSIPFSVSVCVILTASSFAIYYFV